MAPVLASSPDLRVVLTHSLARRNVSFDGHWRDGNTDEGFIIEAWGEGFMVGALLIMACITVAAMRKGILLHKLILCEQLLAMSHGTFCFMAFNGYDWYLSSTASLLYCSYFLHNVVAWIKVKPFFVGSGPFFDPKFGKIVQRVYLGTLLMTIPPLIYQIFNNFRFFNNINDMYRHVRPYEPLMRDPWWIFTNVALLHVIAKSYGANVWTLISRSPRLGILLTAICLAIIFTIMDILASVLGDKLSTVDGINPYWKLSLVFKCLTDAIMLDDFKTELKRLNFARMERHEAERKSNALFTSPFAADKEQSFGGNASLYEVEDSNETNMSHQLRSSSTWSPTANRAAPSFQDGPAAEGPGDLDLPEMLTDENQLKEHITGAAGGRGPLPLSSEPVGRSSRKISNLPLLPHSDGFEKKNRRKPASLYSLPSTDSWEA